MPDAGAGRGLGQVPGRRVVALLRAGHVKDRLGAGQRLVQTVPGEQVPGDVLDALRVLPSAPAQDPQVVPGCAQQRHGVRAEGAGAAGDEDLRVHDHFLV
ncbi:hypothetical protein ABIA31_004492 [Catenulispora sp. MAP5-51]